MDIVLSLRRTEGAQRSTIRHLYALGRFGEMLDVPILEWTLLGYVALRTETGVAEAEARRKVLDVAPTNEADALREDDLLAAAEVKRMLGWQVIAEHLESNRLRRVGVGKKGEPYRFWQPSSSRDEKVSDPLEAQDASEGNERGTDTVGQILPDSIPSVV